MDKNDDEINQLMDGKTLRDVVSKCTFVVVLEYIFYEN